MAEEEKPNQTPPPKPVAPAPQTPEKYPIQAEEFSNERFQEHTLRGKQPYPPALIVKAFDGVEPAKPAPSPSNPASPSTPDKK